MDYRNILAFAAVIFAAGYFVRSFQSAYAFPQGPNVSLGSNPIEHFFRVCTNNTNSNSLIFTNTTSQTFIITDIQTQGTYTYQFFIDGALTLRTDGYYEEGSLQLLSGIKINPNESFQCQGGGSSSSSRSVFISGYYTH